MCESVFIMLLKERYQHNEVNCCFTSEICRVLVSRSIIPCNLVGGYFALKREILPSSKTLVTACWVMGSIKCGEF
jgi:hypothetical protein